MTRPIAGILLGSLSALAADPALVAVAKGAARGECAAADQSIRAYLNVSGKPRADAYRLIADCYARAGEGAKSITALTIFQPEE